jgi:kynurenine formamidase
MTYKETGRSLSNWGRWGDDDERGTLNFVTPELVRAAAGSIRSGRAFELSIPVGGEGPPRAGSKGNRVNPVHLMNILPPDLATPDGMAVTDDYIIMPLQSGTQWDGLAHVGYDGELYNGVPTDTVGAVSGATRNAIDKTLPGMTGRGVLLDIARLEATDWLPAGHGITPTDLEHAERSQRVQVASGDAVLVRTGWRRKAVREGWDGWLGVEPGLTPDCAEWLHAREVATVASDNWGVEVQPAAEGWMPLHCILIRDMGMMLGEYFDLEGLAEDCARDGQWGFFLSAPPLRITGGAGSPVSPIAIK